MLPDIYRPRTPPMNHQLRSLELGWSREGFAYLLEMGLGKSRVLIDDFCLNHVSGEVDALLILTSKSVYTNWTRDDEENPGELQKWLWDGIRETARVYTYRAGRKVKDAQARLSMLDAASPGVRIVAMNVEALSSTMDAEDFAMRFLRAHKSMIVVDESTLVKSHKAGRTKISIRLARHARRRRILTGTLITGSPSDAWSQFEFLGPGEELLRQRSFTNFQARYCILRDLVVSGRTIKTEVGSQNLPELKEIVAEHSVRFRKKECLDLPPKIFVPREVEATEEQRRVYSELRRTAISVIRGTQEVTTDIVLTQMLRLHQVLCGHVTTDDGQLLVLDSLRPSAMMDVLEEGRGQQAIIWCWYRPDVTVVTDALVRAYGADSVAQWHGGVRQEERERHEAEFQAGRRRFMVATQHAGARGRTWTAASLVVYFSNGPDLELRLQSEDRPHRIGQLNQVTYVDLTIPKSQIPTSQDARILEILRGGMDVARAITGDGWEAWI